MCCLGTHSIDHFMRNNCKHNLLVSFKILRAGLLGKCRRASQGELDFGCWILVLLTSPMLPGARQGRSRYRVIYFSNVKLDSFLWTQSWRNQALMMKLYCRGLLSCIFLLDTLYFILMLLALKISFCFL